MNLSLSVLGLVCAVTLYLFLGKALPPLLKAETTQRPLGWAHAVSGTCILATLLVSWGNGWSIRCPVLFCTVLIGSGLVAGLRTQLLLATGKAGYLARVQFRLTPLLLPVLALWVGWSSSDVVYHDAEVSVEVIENTGMFSEITTTWITLYQTRYFFFEERLTSFTTAGAPLLQEQVATKERWTTVSSVTLNPTLRQGVIHYYWGHLPFKY
jgi:hypothetical protein